MVKRMLIDATHPEETRVVVLDGTRLDEFDVETSTKKQIKGNIYLAKVVRVEPSLQAAFVDYGGNRHGFLAFSEIHPDYYQIPVADRERLLAEAARHEEEEDERERNRGRNRRRGRNDGRGGQNQSTDSAPPQGDQGQDAQGNPTPGDHGDHSHDDHGHDHAHDDHAHDNQPDHDHGAHADHDHDHDHDHHGDDTIPLAFIPPAITGPATSDDHEHDDHADDGHDAPKPDNVISVAGDDSAPVTVGGDAEHAPETAATPTGETQQAEGTQVAVVQGDATPGEGEHTAETKAAGVETVGGEDPEDDEDEEDDDKQRRRFVASRHYKIQEVIKRRQIILVQVVKEERGNKGAALTTYLSLAGRYCVLMPNSARGGGVSRKITSAQDRRRLKQIVGDLELPRNMAVILRTAGAERSKAEIKRDYEYLQRTWNNVREVTMTSRAPALVHEEASLIKRSIRDIYSRDIEEVWVEGEEGYKTAKDFMRMLTPSHAKKVQRYKDDLIPLYHRYQVESQMESLSHSTVQLRSGGSIVFGQTEALVAIDVNSGRATRERHIEETAYKTNMEAADEIARQLRLRDLAGLVVIDFIDMEDNRNNHAVERRLKEALKADRARIQVGRISHFGLLELSRQRLRPSLIETNFRVCSHCSGTGLVRSTESAAVYTLRMVEEEGGRRRSSELTVTVHPDVALYLLNYKREALASVESRFGLKVFVLGDSALIAPNLRIDRVKSLRSDEHQDALPAPAREPYRPAAREIEPEDADDADEEEEEDEKPARGRENNNRQQGRDGRGDNRGDRNNNDRGERGGNDRGGENRNAGTAAGEDGEGRKRRRRRRKRGGRDGQPGQSQPGTENTVAATPGEHAADSNTQADGADDEGADQTQGRSEGAPEIGPDGEIRRGRRRGRRGGRRRRRGGEGNENGLNGEQNGVADDGVESAYETPFPSDNTHPAAPTVHADPTFEPASVAAPSASSDAQGNGEQAGEQGNSEPRRGFFRALKEGALGWRRNDTATDAPAEQAQTVAPAPAAPAPVAPLPVAAAPVAPTPVPEPIAVTPPPAPAKVVQPEPVLQQPPAPQAEEIPAGPPRKGWWNQPKSE